MSKKSKTEKYFYINNKIVGYRIGHMDLYSIAVQYTPLENCSFYQCVFKENIDGNKLIAAVRAALDYFPLFKTQLAYKGEYYLKFNNNDVSKAIKHTNVEDRPKEFGSIKTTNGYLFQICYFDNNITFEWCHGVTDGVGALNFLSTILDKYFNVETGPIPKEFPLDLPFENIRDKSIKTYGQIKQAPGFKNASFPIVDNGYKCRTTILKIPAKDVLSLSKRVDATPVAILAPLLCKAIRSHIPTEAKNRNVSCGIIVEGRRPLNFPTMHNFIFNKVITYTDALDNKDIQTQGTIFRSILDLYCLKENLVGTANSMMQIEDRLYRIKPRFLRLFIMKRLCSYIKTRMNNIAFTYIGRVPFSQTVKDQMTDFTFRSWPDIGGCICAMADLNGTLILNITDNYLDPGIVDTFIKLCKNNNINVVKEKPFIFEQANLRLK